MLTEKGHGLLIGMLIVLFVAGGLFGAYYFSQKQTSVSIPQQVTQNVVTTPQPTSVPTPGIAPSAQEINNFPIFTDAIFIESRFDPPCTKGMFGPTQICNAQVYEWQVNSNYDQVSAFYKEDKSHSGWICRGGAGEYTNANEASGVTSCKKGSLIYDLHINTTNGVSTIILPVDQGPPTGN